MLGTAVPRLRRAGPGPAPAAVAEGPAWPRCPLSGRLPATQVPRRARVPVSAWLGARRVLSRLSGVRRGFRTTGCCAASICSSVGASRARSCFPLTLSEVGASAGTAGLWRKPGEGTRLWAPAAEGESGVWNPPC